MTTRDSAIVSALIVITIIALLVSYLSVWLAVAVFVVLTVLFFSNAIREVPNTPPSKAVVTLFKERLPEVLDEGYRILPLYPWMFGMVVVNVEKISDTLPSEKVRTPDNAEISVVPSIDFIPGIKDNPESYIAYLNNGGKEGVKKILHSLIDDRVKTWAGSNREGPSSWKEAQNMKPDVHGVLSKMLLGDSLAEIGGDFQCVPTNTWMKFFDNPKSEPSEYDVVSGWAEKIKDADGKVVSFSWNGLQSEYDRYTAEQQGRLKTNIKDRRDQIKKLREGGASFGDKNLGITITRFTINEVRLEGEAAKAADKAEKERLEKVAEKTELDAVSDRVVELIQKHPGLTAGEAFKIVMLQQGKISGHTYDFGLSEVLKELARRFTPSNPPGP